jgi:Double zinc ribbon domain
MDAEASPSRSISTHLRGALDACRGAWRLTSRLALDIALPTLCVACREPVDGEGVCAECWAKLSFIAPPFCPRLGIPFVYDPGPGLLSMEAIADPPAYARARAAVRYDDVARTLVHALKYQDRTDLAPPWAAGWRGPGTNCSTSPMCWFRCRCTGGAAGAAATTSQGRWRVSSSGKAA